MRAVIFSFEATEHLDAIEGYIAARSSVTTAAAFVDSIIEYCAGLTQFPDRGRARDDLRPGLRLVGFRRRVTIAFSVDPQAVTILGVYWGGRNVDSWLGDH
ncbi:type II toxin-antitoxin system RelE/ParE family toxin [Aurantimonas sp. 22II-16-19i]|uniref:type II toxin-antitoxin system RelE/ParE family toxin n=1 Tax=Aurantimonas sp. 22II-16-19i TaxID=1317114 RepID=UPI0009F7C496|nr:type II toxin-antitoxin system RelE/ParE family toxin [Aurantimonas sp. 22II-16-19i]ORE99020.1 plasmid stabilization system [Aurantimonas sp. 22II-16-19i]